MAQRLSHIKEQTKEVTVVLHGVTVTTTVPKREYDLTAGTRLLDRIHKQAGDCSCTSKCTTCHCR